MGSALAGNAPPGLQRPRGSLLFSSATTSGGLSYYKVRRAHASVGNVRLVQLASNICDLACDAHKLR